MIGAAYQKYCRHDLTNANDFRYVRLGADGSVLFFTCPPGASPEPKGIPHPSMKSVVDTKIDAESKCEVSTYKDGTFA